MRVDFPAPFSPTTACISPCFIVNETFLSAITPGNSFVIFFISRIKSLSKAHPHFPHTCDRKRAEPGVPGSARSIARTAALSR